MGIYDYSKLSWSVFQEIKSCNFDFDVVPIKIPGTANKIKESPLVGIDYRAKYKHNGSFDSVFSGIDFDKRRVQTQATALFDGERPVAVATIVVLPKWWNESEFFFEAIGEEIRVRTIDDLVGNVDFCIVPGWAVVDPEYAHCLKGIIKPGTEATKKSINLLLNHSDSLGYKSIVVQTVMGTWDYTQRDRLYTLAKITGRGSAVHPSGIPFSLDRIGKERTESRGGVKLAKKLGLKRLEGVGGMVTLGPVFVSSTD